MSDGGRRTPRTAAAGGPPWWSAAGSPASPRRSRSPTPDVRVTLLEGRPRLGGLAFSFRRGELTVDNGQHVYLRCCTAYRWFLDRIDGGALAPLQDRLDVPVLDVGRARARGSADCGRDALPVPLHLAAQPRAYPHLSLAERAPVGRAALALKGLDLGRSGPGRAGLRRPGSPRTASRRAPSRRCGTWSASPPSTRSPATPRSPWPRWCSRPVCCPTRAPPTSAGRASRWANCTTRSPARRSTPRACAPNSAHASPPSPVTRTGAGASRFRGETHRRGHRRARRPAARGARPAARGRARRPRAAAGHRHRADPQRPCGLRPQGARRAVLRGARHPGPVGLRPHRGLRADGAASTWRCPSPPRRTRSTCPWPSCASATCPNWSGCCPPRAAPRCGTSSSPGSAPRPSPRRRVSGGCAPAPVPEAPGLYLAGAWTATGWPATMESAVRSGVERGGRRAGRPRPVPVDHLGLLRGGRHDARSGARAGDPRTSGTREQEERP